ncbi:glycosyltransferase family 2 protein [Patescibacteria group bacterium]|nr:glycosyltransferase family 2 protein [Patescibacteria group bacterium]
MENTKTYSIIIPAYNEADTIAKTLNGLKVYIENNNLDCNIVVVNDGSTDDTQNILKQIPGILFINHPYNKGYGASVKTGVAAVNSEWIITFDSDGQHKLEDIKRLIDAKQDFDMVVGARKGYQGPAIRQPGKKVLHKVAEFLVEKKIDDLNSGLRLLRKEHFQKYARILPNAFSWTSTITLAFFKDNLNVKYIPIEINKRQGGKSMVKTSDAVKTLMLILRIIMLFSPLRIFLPASVILFTLGCASTVYDLWMFNISDTTILLFISSILIFFFGLLADQIAAIRRELK